MDAFFIGVTALFGLIIGSFINVVVARHGTGMGVSGRSKCFSCGTTLTWSELIPVFSYLAQQRKCRSCGSRISSEYLCVELAAAALFAGVAYHSLLVFYSQAPVGILMFAAALFFWSVMLAIVAYDLRHMVIPDSFSFALGVTGIAVLTLHNLQNPFMTWIPDILGGAGIAAFFFLVWLFTRGRGMGLGDAKIALGIGWFLGVRGAVSALFFSFWIGLVFALMLISGAAMRDNALLRGSISGTMKREIPFAPFLALAAALVYFANVYLPFF